MSTMLLERPSEPPAALDGGVSLVRSTRPDSSHLAASTHRRRPRSFDRRALGSGAPLVVDEGCDVRIGGRAADPALRQALLAWLPLTYAELAVYEGGSFGDEPPDAVALLLRPPTIWSLRDAVAAERVFPRGDRFDPERFAALEEHASTLVRSAHLRRLREAARLMGRRLPTPGLPTASATVAAGCSAVAADDAICATIAARQLARYATSALVAGAAATLPRATATVNSS